MSADLFPSMVRMLSALMIVMGVVFLCLFAFRRVMARASSLGNRARWIRMIATYPLGPRKFIALVEVADEILAIGVTSQQISMLCKVDKGKEGLERIASVPSSGRSLSAFREQLNGLIGRGLRSSKEAR